jgi:hypothetical protein
MKQVTGMEEPPVRGGSPCDLLHSLKQSSLPPHWLELRR